MISDYTFIKASIAPCRTGGELKSPSPSCATEIKRDNIRACIHNTRSFIQVAPRMDITTRTVQASTKRSPLPGRSLVLQNRQPACLFWEVLFYFLHGWKLAARDDDTKQGARGGCPAPIYFFKTLNSSLIEQICGAQLLPFQPPPQQEAWAT